jgi:HAD superfamily hydrolase (TIGR01456 family)
MSLARLAQLRRSFAIAFDVDGVLWRAPLALPCAAPVLQSLVASRIPHIFMTNGGGKLEEKKALEMAKLFDVPILPSQVCLAHTPMREVAARHRNDLVLVVGKRYDQLKDIAHSYGFMNVVTVEEYHAQHPLLYPDVVPPPVERVEKWHQPIGAVLALIDPLMWGRELQICCDVLRSNGVPGQLVDKQVVPLYNACADFEYATQFPVPRFGAGAFNRALMHLYHGVTGRDLQHVQFGKPHGAQYEFAELQIQQLAKEWGGPQVERFYMVGDNPVTDIQGANRAGEHWFSILTRTGMHTHAVNDTKHPADVLVEDALAGLEWIIQQEFAHQGIK